MKSLETKEMKTNLMFMDLCVGVCRVYVCLKYAVKYTPFRAKLMQFKQNVKYLNELSVRSVTSGLQIERKRKTHIMHTQLKLKAVAYSFTS